MPRESWAREGDPVEIGRRLRGLREQEGLSQRQLSEAAGVKGVTAAYISRIEAGDRYPSLNALRALAGPLNTTPRYLEVGVDAGGCDGGLDASLATRVLEALNRGRLDEAKAALERRVAAG